MAAVADPERLLGFLPSVPREIEIAIEIGIGARRAILASPVDQLRIDFDPDCDWDWIAPAGRSFLISTIGPMSPGHA